MRKLNLKVGCLVIHIIFHYGLIQLHHDTDVSGIIYFCIYTAICVYVEKLLFLF